MITTQALLDPTPPAADQHRVDAVFKMAEEMIGFVPAGMRLYGISPTLLELFAGTVGYFRGETQLSGKLSASIRYLVSERIDCKFCIDLNETFLAGMGVDLDSVRAMRGDITKAPVAAEELPLLKLAVAAVEQPDADKSELIEQAREAGWSDRAIFDAVLQAASNRAFNLVLKTFNVETQEAFV